MGRNASRVISFEHKGDFSKAYKFLNEIAKPVKLDFLNKYGKKGVSVLSSATPVRTGLTANSWYYDIEQNQNGIVRINFNNSNVKKDYCNIAIILDTGHGTRNGGWVEGRNYINPSIQPIFDQLTDDAWKEVINR